MSLRTNFLPLRGKTISLENISEVHSFVVCIIRSAVLLVVVEWHGLHTWEFSFHLEPTSILFPS